MTRHLGQRLRSFIVQRVKIGRHLSLAARLHTGFSLVLVLVAIVGGLSWVQTGQLLNKLTTVTNEDFKRMTLTFEMQEAVDATLLSVSKMAQSSDPEDVKFEVSNLALTRKRYESAAAALEKNLASSVASGASARLTQQYQQIKVAAEQAFVAINAFSALALNGGSRDDLSAAAASQVQAPQDQWIKALAELRQGVSEAMSASTQETQSSAMRGRTVMTMVVVAALIIGVIAAFIISRGVTGPLRDAIALARRVAAGDLTAALSTNRHDEIGALLDALRDMQVSLRKLLGEIGMCAETIQVASAEVAVGNADLAQRTETTSSQLQQAAADLQQLMAAVKQGASAVDRANGLAQSASSAAQRGGDVVQEVVSSMMVIQTSSRKIADITGVIDSIAFQTNILALNAAVEAARAGEAGRGFAVVANEVRGLAQRSAAAAKDIKALIDASVSSVQSGTTLVTEAGQSMAQIVLAVDEVRGEIGQVSASAAEQSGGIEHVNQSVSMVEYMTQQNAALVEQSAAASESLKDQASRLNALLGAFQLVRISD